MLGQYELLGRIAMGGMAEILRARQRSEAGFEKDVVIKRILPQYIDDLDFIRMFQDEAVLAAKLSHPNIVQVFDFKNIDGAYFIAMEYVEGVDLRRLVQYGAKQGNAIGPNRAVQVALAMARGLGHAHERVSNGMPLKIVHRDVSPHNVLVSMAGDVKVMDFGIAKAAARAVRTSTGILKGKLGYMSPEQSLGSPDIDHRTDIYATGIVLWEMLANRRLFQGDNEMEVLARVQRGDVTPIRSVYPEISAELEACVQKLLARDKEQRYQRMRDAEKDLARILTSLGGPEAASLEDYAQTVVPKEIVHALQGLGQVKEEGGTKPLRPEVPTSSSTVPTASMVADEAPDLAATHIFESTDNETDKGKTLSAPRVVGTIKAQAPQRVNQAKLIVAGSLGLGFAAIVGAALTATLVRAPAPVVAEPAPAQVAPLPALPEPVQVQDAVPHGDDGAAVAGTTVPAGTPPSPAEARARPAPAAPRTAAPAAVSDADGSAGGAARSAQAPQRNESPTRKSLVDTDNRKSALKPIAKLKAPEPARTGSSRLELEGCPIGAIVFEESRALGAVSERNRDSFPVQAGAHTYSVRAADGALISGPTKLNLAEGEMETFRCR